MKRLIKHNALFKSRISISSYALIDINLFDDPHPLVAIVEHHRASETMKCEALLTQQAMLLNPTLK